MPKRNPRSSQPTSSGPSTTTVMLVGGVIVVLLLAFSLTRIFKRQQQVPEGAVTETSAAMPAGAPQGDPGAGQPPSASLPPLASPRSGAVPPMITPRIAEAEPQGAELDAVPRVEPEKVLEQLEAKQVTILDVRDADSYVARHIPGSLHIPLTHIDGEVPYLPRDKPIVAYCT